MKSFKDRHSYHDMEGYAQCGKVIFIWRCSIYKINLASALLDNAGKFVTYAPVLLLPLQVHSKITLTLAPLTFVQECIPNPPTAIIVQRLNGTLQTWTKIGTLESRVE